MRKYILTSNPASLAPCTWRYNRNPYLGTLTGPLFYPDGMIIYNVTTKVDHQIAADWLQWLKQEHIPAVIATGCFTRADILRLTEVDETDGLTYAVQYHAENKDGYNRYVALFADPLRKRATDKWGAHFIAFNSVLQVVN